MFSGIAGEEHRVALTLYTDAFVIRGSIATRQRRVTDILNQAENNFIVLTDVTMDEFGTRTVASRAEFAQVNLGSVLFAVASDPVEAIPELRTPKVPEQALISIPPFKVIGRIHLLPERDVRSALEELIGRFLPVTEAAYWSDTVGEARATAALVAVNHARAQILAPHREVDPWAGLSAPATEASAEPAEAAVNGGAGSEAADPWGGTATATPAADPWGAPSASGGGGASDPWRDLGEPRRDEPV